MAGPLVTKLFMPPPRPAARVVARPRLIERLNAGLGGKLSLLCAPAGFGKTTLVAEWIEAAPAPRFTWLSLDEGDNDPVQFLTYLIAALQQVDCGIGRTVQQVLQSPPLPRMASLVASLINDISAAGIRLALVLDDYQLISTPAIHEILQFLVEHQPPNFHLVINTREEPPLPLARLRARGQVTEIRQRDLRFTAEEAAAFLNQSMGLNLSPQAVAALEARTEGWIAGLQLAALALQEERDVAGAEAFIAAFTGDDRYVMDYLLAEVLERQPEWVRRFLLQTSILDRLCGSLCDAVSLIPDSLIPDSQSILEYLERHNLFVIPLDHRREWYRYHRLFAEALRATLKEQERTTLHRRAARWYEGHGFLSQAIGHALAYAAACGEWEDAERLIRLAVEGTLDVGAVLTVRGWLEAIPEERVRADGELATYKGWALTLSGDMALAEEYAALAEARLAQSGIATPAGAGAQGGYAGKLLVLRSFIAVLLHEDYQAGIELAGGALQALPEGQAGWRLIALWAMAESQERTCPITEAIATARQAARLGRAQGRQIFAVVIEASLASALRHHGRRREATAVCEEAIARFRDETGRPSPIANILFSWLGVLCYEANQLELARECLEQGLALGQQLASPGNLIASCGLAAPTLYAQGEVEAALDALRTAYRLSTETSFSDVGWVLAEEANIRLKEGDLAFARRWAETGGMSPDDTPEYLRIEAHLVYARLLLAEGREADARRWLARVEDFVRERGMARWLISVHILQALAAERSGERRAARDSLARAVELAAPEDYFRAFLDEDRQVLALLPEVRQVAPAFVAQLLAYAGAQTPARATGRVQALVEPLSERELEVLALIAEGYSNAEIAQELYITTGTVKRHVNNIYGKLDVHSRTQALARARELGALE